MIKVTNTENLTGVTISGTHDDIHQIYEAIGRVIGPGLSEDATSLRILGVSYDLRHCFMGDREIEIVENNYDEDLQRYHEMIHSKTNVRFKVNILWLEVMFAVLALDDFVNKYKDDKIFNKMMKDAGCEDEVKAYYANNRYEDIALVNLFQEKVWTAFREACGDAAYKRLYKKARNQEYHFAVITNYRGFCTQYLDRLEMKYIHSKPEKREKLLATLVRKIIVQGDDYLQVEDDIMAYALRHHLPKEEIVFSDVEYPEVIEW